eukprot:gene9675-20118_t
MRGGNNWSYFKNFVIKINFLQLKESTENVEGYSGPILDYEYMDAGCSINELGLEIMVGPSLVASGQGLYIRLNPDVDSVTLPAGTPLCGYSKGTLQLSETGDKTVGYKFTDTSYGVFFRKKLIPLIVAIQAITDEKSDATNVFLGHLLLFNETSNQLQILPDPEYTGGNYFIPYDIEEYGPGNLGQFANDLAYEGDETTAESYVESSKLNNILEIVWRMDVHEGKLVPTWPVVCLSRDVLFTNKDPMECGVQYSWRYWEAHRKRLQVENIEKPIFSLSARGFSGLKCVCDMYPLNYYFIEKEYSNAIVVANSSNCAFAYIICNMYRTARALRLCFLATLKMPLNVSRYDDTTMTFHNE